MIEEAIKVSKPIVWKWYKLLKKYYMVEFEDLMQEAGIYCLKALEGYNADRGKFETYIRYYVNGMFHGKFKNWKKYNFRLEVLSLDFDYDTYDGLENYVSYNDKYSLGQYDFIMEILEELNMKERYALVMYYFDDMEVSEIAEIFNKKNTYVINLMFKARAKLKEKLNDRLADRQIC